MSEAGVSKITLDLTGRIDVPKIEGSKFTNFIQQEAFHRIRTILKTRVEDAKSYQDKPYTGIVHDRSHNAIAVLGGRGSGKTTFILNALDLLGAEIPNPARSESAADARVTAQTFARVKVLDVIDPTLIEHKEHILVTILSSIKAVVDKQHKDNQRRGNNDENAYAAVIDTLKAVGEGLPALKEIGSNGLSAEAWDNPQYVLQEGLKRARTGVGLEAALQMFITEALKYIDQDVFILPLDDIDTNFESGWPVLEILRKYLTTPKLIVVLSGDFTLYSLLVRDQQWKLLGKLNAIEGGANSKERHDELAREVHRLESQYLQKIIKPGNRIELLPLSFFWEYKFRRDNFLLNFSKNQEGRPISLEEAMAILTFRSIYSNKQDDVHRLAMLILRQPVRTVVHLLRALEVSGLIETTTGTEPVEPEAQIEPIGLREFHTTLTETFLTELQSVGLKADRVNLAPTEAFLTEVHTFLGRNNLWEEGYNLAPTFRDDAPSLASLCLGARLGREMRTSPGLIFDYLVKVCGTRDIKIGLPQETKIDALLSFLALNRQELSGITASRMIGAIRSQGKTVDRRAILRGTVAVYYHRRNRRGSDGSQPVGVREHFGLDEKSKFDHLKRNPYVNGYLDLNYEYLIPPVIRQNQQIGFLFNTWNRLESQLDGENNPGSSFLHLVSILLTDQSGLKSSFLSVLPLVGCLADLLNKNDPTELLDAMGSTMRSYMAPSWGAAGTEDDPEIEDDADTSDRSGDGNPAAFCVALKKWRDYAVDEIEKITPLPPFVLARIWQRFQDTLGKIDDSVRNPERYAGWLLHRQIVAFLNAFLVEESRHRAGESTMTLANPVTTDRYFLLNLQRSEKLSHQSIFDVIFSCPLWTPYLRQTPKTERFDKGEAHKSVFVQHLERVKNVAPSEPDWTTSVENAVRIKYRTRVGKEQIHNLASMYDVLNSLLVMGRRAWVSKYKDSDEETPEDTDEDVEDVPSDVTAGAPSSPPPSE